MGRSLGAGIVYGVKVHGEDEGWPLPYDSNTYEHLWPDWVKVEDGRAEDFEEQCTDRLIRVFADFTDPEPEVNWNRRDYRDTPEYKAYDCWLDKRREAQERAAIGSGEGSLDFHRTGTTDYMDVYLGFEVYDFTWSDPKIALNETYDALMTGVLHNEWTSKLERAVEALNFTPTEGFDLQPATFMLVTYR